MKIGIVGKGHVGTAMCKIFPDAVVYDEPQGLGTKEAVNACDVVFVCVPTPQGEDGACDTSIVDYTIGWLKCGVIVLRSTVPVGYTDAQAEKTGKDIVFQPEYYGETPAHPFAGLSARGWLTLGGRREAVDRVVSAYQAVYNAQIQIALVDAKTAELAKYMENAFLAAKVIFCNEFYDLAAAFGVDYNQLRETWLMDPRMGRSHTFVYRQDRGYGGKCLPKDIASITHQGEALEVDTTLLQAVKHKNAYYHAGAGPQK